MTNVTAAKAEKIIWIAYAEKKRLTIVLRALTMGNKQDTCHMVRIPRDYRFLEPQIAIVSATFNV